MTHVNAHENSLAVLAQARYRAPYPLSDEKLNDTLALMLRHKSVRQYTGEPVSDHDLDLIVTAAQSASTSSNTQNWTVVAIRDKARLKRVSEIIGGRDYVENCGVFLVWVADYNRLERAMLDNGVTPAGFGYLEHTLVTFQDIGIGSQNALLAAESLGLGGVYVGSLRNDPIGVNAELGIPQHAFAALGMAIGHPDPREGTGVKPRLPLEAVLHHETYNPTAWKAGVETLEKNMHEYFTEQGNPNHSWINTMIGKLGTIAGMHGREKMQENLAAQGLDSK